MELMLGTVRKCSKFAEIGDTSLAKSGPLFEKKLLNLLAISF
jgi:hypothetical protein